MSDDTPGERELWRSGAMPLKPASQRKISRGALLPGMRTLTHQILEPYRDDHAKARQIAFELEQLPHYLTASAWAALTVAQLEREVMDSVLKAGLSQGVIQSVDDDDRDRIAFAADAYLDHARRAQNAVVHVLRRRWDLHGLAPSLADVVGQIEKGESAIPDKRVADVLVQYWRGTGACVKNYRDLQHYTVPSSDARVTRLSDGRPSFYLFLPSNR